MNRVVRGTIRAMEIIISLGAIQIAFLACSFLASCHFQRNQASKFEKTVFSKNHAQKTKSQPIRREPTIEFAETMRDFGTISQFEKATCFFKFKNVGEKHLSIDRVSSSCSCTAILSSARKIQPGKSGEIKVRIDTRSRGRFTKFIYVYSNDPRHAVSKLEIKGVIKGGLVFSPPSLYYGTVPRGRVITRKIAVLDPDRSGLHITKVECASDLLTVSITAGDKQKGELANIAVRLEAAASVGYFKKEVVVHTNSQKQPLLRFPVYGKIVDEIVVSPEVAFFGFIGKEETVKHTIWIYASSERVKFKISNVESDLPFVTAIQSTLTRGRKYKIELRVCTSGQFGRFTGEVKVHTDNKNQPLLRIPVMGLIKSK